MTSNPIKVWLLATTFAVVSVLSSAEMSSAVVTFDWAIVGDPGNAPDTLEMTKCPGGCTGDGTTGYGAVDYTYRISKTHVTNTQYVEFLNSVDPNGDVAEAALNPPFPQPPQVNGIYNPNMSFSSTTNIGVTRTGGIDYTAGNIAGSKYSVKSGQENYPAMWISWNAAARFANWLHNGQGSGDTESGVYNNIPAAASDPIPEREEGASYFLPSEDEFYKAAYYDPTKNGGAGGYWQYGTQSDTAPTVEGPAGGTNSANYAMTDGNPGTDGDTFWQTGFSSFQEGVDYLTDVGAYTNSSSYYGLQDADGLAYQWTEDSRPNTFNASQELPIYRGGSWRHGEFGTGAAYRNGQWFAHTRTWHYYGLRIASIVESVSGDFDGDGDVDGQDFLDWQRNDGTALGLTDWQDNYANGSLSSITTVPEPTCLASLVMIVAMYGMFRQRV